MAGRGVPGEFPGRRPPGGARGSPDAGKLQAELQQELQGAGLRDTWLPMPTVRGGASARPLPLISQIPLNFYEINHGQEHKSINVIEPPLLAICMGVFITCYVMHITLTSMIIMQVL